MSRIDAGSAPERLTGGAAGSAFVPDPVDTSRGRLTGLLTTARREYVRAAREGSGGRDAQAHYAGQMDAIVRALVNAAAAVTPGRVAVCALGGYGRRALCLHSDVDLLIVFDGAIGPEQERLVKAVLQPLWDLQLVVGNHVRELAELDALDGDNPEFTMALLDVRFIAGDEALGAAVKAKAAHMDPSQRAHAVDALLALVDQRYAECNGTIYQLEPDVKSAPGGLRDITAAGYLRGLKPDAFEAERGRPIDALADAEDFLLRVRSLLHLESGRNHNVLSHELQERTAERLGYPGSEPRQRVERLMSDYFRHARIVSRSLDWARRTAPVPVGPNLGLSRDGIRFLDPIQAARTPVSWIGAFQAAIDHGTDVSEDALSCIQQHVERYRADDFFPKAQDRGALLRLLKPKPGLYARLSEMHDCGLLGRVFPEFQAISWRVVRDFYHKYTVDEHTLLTIRNLERLGGTTVPYRQRFRNVFNELATPELLVLALLLHDVGKWRDDDHALESVRMAEDVLDRIQVDGEAREMVLFLIRQHLRMSLAAFRRDTEDPEIVRTFASLVGTEDRLKMLCLMTVVDVEAVSPDTLTPWKAELLWRLYVDTYNHLTQRYGDELIERNQAGLNELLAGRPQDLSPAEITGFLEGLPQRYLQLFSSDAVYRHVRLARDIRPDEVHLSLEQKDSLWTLAVATLDRPFLFSNICGVLSSFGMNIRRGHAFTNPNGLVLDVFEFTDEERFLDLNPDAQTQVLRVLQDVVSGRADVTERLRGREGSILNSNNRGRIATVVHTDSNASSRYTILDIVTANALGLLYRISRVISQHGCDVDLVLIATEGERAIDVFHITKAGSKLTEAEQQALTADLQRTLEGTPT